MTVQAAPTSSPAPEPGRGTPRIVPVLIPHGGCGPGCPLCPPVLDAAAVEQLMPGPADVFAAMRRYVPERAEGAPQPGEADRGGRTLLAFYGGSLAALPHARRADLLDAGEREFRSNRIEGIRLVCDLPRLFRAPLGEWRVRGVRSIEVLLLSTHPDVLQAWDGANHPALAERAVQKARWLGLEIGIQLMPGLPGDTHDRSVETARAVARMNPSFVRILPALALEGTRLERWWRDRSWSPMSQEQAVGVCTDMLTVFREAGVAVARIGLQPEADLIRGPLVLDGPYHPSLRHQVESRLFRGLALEQARLQPFAPTLTLRFHPADESYVRGPENRTLGELRRRFRFQRIALRADPTLSRGTLASGSDP